MDPLQYPPDPLNVKIAPSNYMVGVGVDMPKRFWIPSLGFLVNDPFIEHQSAVGNRRRKVVEAPTDAAYDCYRPGVYLVKLGFGWQDTARTIFSMGKGCLFTWLKVSVRSSGQRSFSDDLYFNPAIFDRIAMGIKRHAIY